MFLVSNIVLASNFAVMAAGISVEAFAPPTIVLAVAIFYIVQKKRTHQLNLFELLTIPLLLAPTLISVRFWVPYLSLALGYYELAFALLFWSKLKPRQNAFGALLLGSMLGCVAFCIPYFAFLREVFR